MAYHWVLPVHTIRVNNSYQSLLLDLTKLSRSRIDWLLMPPKGESRKGKMMRCLIKTLQTRPSWCVNGNGKKKNIGYWLLLLIKGEERKTFFYLTGPQLSRLSDSWKSWYPKKKYNGSDVGAENFGFSTYGLMSFLKPSKSS